MSMSPLGQQAEMQYIFDEEMRKENAKKITISRNGKYVRVFKNGELMWTENLDIPIRSYGGTAFRKYAVDYINEHPEVKKLYAQNTGQGGFFRHIPEHSENAIKGSRSRVAKCDKKFKRIRTVDVGRPGHHKILVGVTGKKGPRGGTTEKIGGLRTYKMSLDERLRRAEQLSNRVAKRVRS